MAQITLSSETFSDGLKMRQASGQHKDENQDLVI